MRKLLAGTWMLWRKELRVELRTGEILITTALFATLVAVLSSLAFYVDPKGAPALAPGVLWIAIAFSGVLGTGRSWSRELEHDVFRALLLSPVPRAAIYLSKVLAGMAFMVVVEVILVVEVGVLYSLDLFAVLGPLVTLLLLGTFGFAAAGNLFAALTVRSRARDMMLAVTVLPIVAPALLSGVVGTRELLAMAPMSEVVAWMQLLGAFDLAVLAAGITLFEPLVAD
jgi:heme exporter protein B